MDRIFIQRKDHMEHSIQITRRRTIVHNIDRKWDLPPDFLLVQNGMLRRPRRKYRHDQRLRGPSNRRNRLPPSFVACDDTEAIGAKRPGARGLFGKEEPEATASGSSGICPNSPRPAERAVGVDDRK